jgi:hypothetical protein
MVKRERADDVRTADNVRTFTFDAVRDAYAVLSRAKANLRFHRSRTSPATEMDAMPRRRDRLVREIPD